MATIGEAYRNAYGEALKSKPLRFVLFQPRDGCGWGNKLRGLTLSFVFALCTKRILVVNDYLITEHILPPDGTDWSMKGWKAELGKLSGSRQMDLRLRPDDFDAAAWRRYETESMDSLFPERLIILTQGVSFIDALLRNPNHEPFLRTCGIDTTSKLSWLGIICGYLLARPTEKLRHAVKKVSRKLAFPSHVNFGIQFRTFYDIGGPNLKHLHSFLAGVKEDLVNERKAEAKPTIYVLTDDPQVTKRVSEELKDFGQTICWSHHTIHTAEINQGLGRLIERVLVKLVGTRAQDFDLLFWLPSQWRPRPQSSVLAEWFLLGECSRIYSIFTSFAAFAAARTGNSSILMRYDTERRVVETMTNEKYFF